MANAHKRRKQPEVVRRNLLDHAARIAAEAGITAVTVQAVSAAAGVTKGGFTHHFPSKQALIDALFQELLDETGTALAERVKADPEPHGAFTRAYLDVVLNPDSDERLNIWASLAILMLNDSDLRKMWADWFSLRLDEHQETDIDLVIVRLATDGLWLSDISGVPLPDREQLCTQLVQLTLPRGG